MCRYKKDPPEKLWHQIDIPPRCRRYDEQNWFYYLVLPLVLPVLVHGHVVDLWSRLRKR
jgi:hypothetical protein